MPKEKSISTKGMNLERVPVVAAFLLYILGAFANFYFRFGEFNTDTDTISYIGLAQKYARGEFWDGVTSYWGPFTSWLLAPFYLFGVEPLRAVSALSSIMGVFALLGIWRLTGTVKMERFYRVAILYPAVTILWFMRTRIADLTFLVPLLFYFSEIFRRDYPLSKFRALSCGFWGGFAYLVKTYAFPFFLLHFTIFNFIHYFRQPTKENAKVVRRQYAIGLALWACIVFPWLGITYSKYGKISVGDAGRFTWNILNPDSTSTKNYELVPGFGGMPTRELGFIKPSGREGLSSWEEPLLETARSKPWSPFQSAKYFNRFISLILKNFYTIYNFYLLFSGFVLLLLPAGLLYCMRPFSELMNDEGVFFPFLSMILFLSGFLPLTVEERYIWIGWILYLIIAGLFLSGLSKYRVFTKTRRGVSVALIFASFFLYPVKNHYKFRHTGRPFYETGVGLFQKCKVTGNIASNDNWDASLFISVNMKGHYFGTPKPGESALDLQSDLEKFQIDYFFLWDPPNEARKYPFLEKIPKWELGQRKDFPAALNVYALKKGNSDPSRLNCL